MAQTTDSRTNLTRFAVIGVLVLAGFFGAYRFAIAQDAQPATGAATGALAAVGSTAASGDSATPACACCGSTAPTEGGVTGDLAEGTAAVEGGVQKISVDLSQGYYQPNQIVLKAGVPAEITFGQSTGCTGQVISEALGFSEDLSAGPRTVKIAAPEKGEYAFSCGMQMVFGKIVVK